MRPYPGGMDRKGAIFLYTTEQLTQRWEDQRAIKNLMLLPFECIALAVVTEAVYQIETKRLRTAHR